MAAPIIPSADYLVGVAINAMVAAMPATMRHFNNPNSNWSTLPAMWRAQVLLNLARLSDEAKSARLRWATGDALRTLCASEFDTTLPPDPQTAFAEISLARISTAGGAGVVKKGDQFTKAAAPTGIPLPISAATYTAAQTVYIPNTALTTTVRAVAVRPGSDANVPAFSNYAVSTAIQPAKPLFDPTFAVTSCIAGGGSSGLPESVLIAAAKAYASGQFGPNDNAIIAGILRNQSVRHFAAFRANGSVPYAQVYIADESWAWGDYWSSTIQQQFIDGYQGFGCRSRFGQITNQQIAIAPTIVLEDTDDLANTDEIDDNIRAAARSYFDDRPDWYRWRIAGLRALLSKCDSRILTCSSVVVTDAVTGSVLSEPPNTPGATWSPTLTHYYLTDDNCTTSFVPPN